MGTKLQCESYQLGYSSMRNLNEDSSSSWSSYYEDKTLNEHLYNGFMLRPVNEYSGYDKEMLKRTMLEHEATFRKQVCELHRLYRTQKDLMDELKKQELYKLPMQSGIPQSYLFSSALTSETNGKIWQMPHMTEAIAGFNKAFVEGTDDINPSSDLQEENYLRFSQMPRKNGVSLKDGELSDSKLKDCPKKMFDLQLPADVYIDVEDSDRIEKEHIFKPFCKVSDNSSIISDIERENDVKLTLGTREDCSKGCRISDPILQNGQSTQRLDYLNETKKGLTCEGQSGSVSNHFLSVKPNPEEVHVYQLPTRTNRSFLPRDFFADKDRDEGACSNFFDPDKGRAGQEWQSFNYEDGGKRNHVNNLFTQVLSSEKCPMVSEPLELKVKREDNVTSYDHGEMQKWFEEKPTLGIGSFQRGSPLVDSNSSALTNPQVPGPFSIIPCPEYMSCSPPVVSTSRKPPRSITHIPIAVQALPCFPASEMTNSRGSKLKGSIRNSTINARNKLQSDGDLNSHPGVGIQLSPSQNGFHPNLWSDSNSSPQFKHHSDSSVYENSESCASQKIQRLRKDVSCSPVLPNGTRENGKLEESSEGASWLRTKEFSFSKSFNQSPEKFPSSSLGKARRKQRNRSSLGVNTKKILCFPITDELQQDAIGTSSANDIKTNIKTDVCDVGTVTAKGSRLDIDLNILDISTEVDVPSFTRKTVHEIDLEVPIPSYEALDMVVAENLLLMSLGLTEQLASASCNSLHWFADVVSSKAAKADHDDDDDDNGEDVFESLTLKLKEMKPEEYLLLPQEHGSQKDETSPGTTSLLLTKTRRGQVRKRRQKKDFQKDILPGLVSLSRHEVTEDIQAFDCLMRAMGEEWQCNLTRRCTGRKGSGGQGRGRRRPRSSAVAIAENCSSPAPTEEAPNPKVEINERSMLGWGRTTRRGRRNRVKPGNASLVVS